MEPNYMVEKREINPENIVNLKSKNYVFKYNIQ